MNVGPGGSVRLLGEAFAVVLLATSLPTPTQYAYSGQEFETVLRDGGVPVQDLVVTDAVLALECRASVAAPNHVPAVTARGNARLRRA